MTRLTEERLKDARREDEAATDDLIDFVVDCVALLANVNLRERADLIKDRIKKAARNRDTAKINHITAMVLNRDQLDRRRIKENREALRELCDRMSNIEATLGITVSTPMCDALWSRPQPSEEPIDDPTGTDAGAHPLG